MFTVYIIYIYKYTYTWLYIYICAICPSSRSTTFFSNFSNFSCCSFPEVWWKRRAPVFTPAAAPSGDPESDAGTSYRWENKALICVVQVFGIGMWALGHRLGPLVGLERWWKMPGFRDLNGYTQRERERYIHIYIYKRIFRWSEEEFSWFNMFQHEICTTGFELYDNGYLDSALFCITSGHRVPCCWCLSHFVSPREAQGIQLSKNPVRMVWTWRNSQQIFDWSKNRGNTCVDPRKSEA